MSRTSAGVCWKANAQARLRLICFASAGSTAGFYRRWAGLVPPDVEVCAMELPGRGLRWSEALVRDFNTAVECLFPAVLPLLDKPTALFGHSLGAFLSFDIACRLRDAGLPLPRHLFMSGARAPQTPRREGPLSQLPDAEFTDYLVRLDGTPARVLADASAMEVYLPVLRADASLFDTFEYHERKPLPISISAFGGTADPEVWISELEGWRDHTSTQFSLHLFSGGHFFPRSSEAEFMNVFLPQLASISARAENGIASKDPSPVDGPYRLHSA